MQQRTERGLVGVKAYHFERIRCLKDILSVVCVSSGWRWIFHVQNSHIDASISLKIHRMNEIERQRARKGVEYRYRHVVYVTCQMQSDKLFGKLKLMLAHLFHLILTRCNNHVFDRISLMQLYEMRSLVHSCTHTHTPAEVFSKRRFRAHREDKIDQAYD